MTTQPMGQVRLYLENTLPNGKQTRMYFHSVSTTGTNGSLEISVKEDPDFHRMVDSHYIQPSVPQVLDLHLRGTMLADEDQKLYTVDVGEKPEYVLIRREHLQHLFDSVVAVARPVLDSALAAAKKMGLI